MKRTGCLLVLLLILAAGSVSAHERGDLVLNVEPYMGVAWPSFHNFLHNYMFPGIDFSVRAAADYYFTDNFALNVGLGWGGNINYFLNITGGPRPYHLLGLVFGFIIPPLIPLAINDAMNIDTEVLGDFSAYYIAIPIGLRLAPGNFTMGAGATVNIPIGGSGEYKRKAHVFYPEETITFSLLPYMGWYVDIGADSLGRKKDRVKLGLLLRVSGSFADDVAKPSADMSPHIDVDESSIGKKKFNFVSVGLVARLNIDLANLGGKKKE